MSDLVKIEYEIAVENTDVSTDSSTVAYANRTALGRAAAAYSEHIDFCVHCGSFLALCRRGEELWAEYALQLFEETK